MSQLTHFEPSAVLNVNIGNLVIRLTNTALLGRILAVFLAKIGGSSMKTPETIEGESYLLGLPARKTGAGVIPLRVQRRTKNRHARGQDRKTPLPPTIIPRKSGTADGMTDDTVAVWEKVRQSLGEDMSDD